MDGSEYDAAERQSVSVQTCSSPRFNLWIIYSVKDSASNAVALESSAPAGERHLAISDIYSCSGSFMSLVEYANVVGLSAARDQSADGGMARGRKGMFDKVPVSHMTNFGPP